MAHWPNVAELLGVAGELLGAPVEGGTVTVVVALLGAADVEGDDTDDDEELEGAADEPAESALVFDEQAAVTNASRTAEAARERFMIVTVPGVA